MFDRQVASFKILRFAVVATRNYYYFRRLSEKASKEHYPFINRNRKADNFKRGNLLRAASKQGRVKRNAILNQLLSASQVSNLRFREGSAKADNNIEKNRKRTGKLTPKEN